MEKINIDWTKEFGYKKYTFTLAEIRDLAISTLVLGFLFSTVLKYFQVTTSSSIIINFLVSTAIVAPALIFHELAHKFVAQKYDCKANYVLWPIGVIFSVFMTLISGFVFATLGAVMIATTYSTRLGYRYVGLTNEEIGKISWSGPMVNIALAIIGYILAPFNPSAFNVLVQINLIIALFNMIPFPPLDGSKIFGWSWLTWLGTLASIIILLVSPAYIGLGYSILLSVVVLIAIFFVSSIFAPHRQQRMEHRF